METEQKKEQTLHGITATARANRKRQQQKQENIALWFLLTRGASTRAAGQYRAVSVLCLFSFRGLLLAVDLCL
jgi:hypothetical protein